jgi:hypothetical protein
MATYQVENQWGGSSAPWNPGSTWLLGTRKDQYLVSINITSKDCGKSFLGSVTYNGEGPIDLSAKQKCGNIYSVKVRWGGSTASWHDEGTWIIGGRSTQRCIELKVNSDKSGKVLLGTMKYEGEGPIGFKGTFIPSYKVNNQWGGCSAPWHDGGIWVLSGRYNQDVVSMDIKSNDCGKTLEGTMTYKNEGPIGFKGVHVIDNTYEVFNQWGGSSAPWHRGGDMIIGARDAQRVIQLKFTSIDCGKDFSGDMTYSGEGKIGFKAIIIQQVK